MGRVVLVTGVSHDLGYRFARQVSAHPDVERVVGVDITPPRGEHDGIAFVRADIRNPVIAKVIMRERVDTVVHMSMMPQASAKGRSLAKELNVIGTMQLLAACQRSPDVRAFVLKSSSAVYGSTSRDPAMFTEAMAAKRAATSGFVKDVIDVEAYVRGFARRRPDVAVTLLRSANVLGPTLQTPLSSYLRLPVVPTVLGHDARLQFLADTDLLDVLQHAAFAGQSGTFNVAGDGVMMLSQALRRLGRPAMPVPEFAVGLLGPAVKQARLIDFSPEQVKFFAFGRGIDTTRMRSELGFEPRYTTAGALSRFAEAVEPGLLAAERVRALEAGIAGALGIKPLPALEPTGADGGGANA